MKPRSVLVASFVLLLSAFVFTGGQQPQEPSRAMGSSLAKICLRPELLPPGTDVADLCEHCTSIPVGKDASADGGTMTTHSCDGHYEFRIHVVPGRKFPKGTMRPIMKGGGNGAGSAAGEEGRRDPRGRADLHPLRRLLLVHEREAGGHRRDDDRRPPRAVQRRGARSTSWNSSASRSSGRPPRARRSGSWASWPRSTATATAASA